MAKFIIAVDLGGTNLKIGLIDSKYRIIDKQVISTPSLLSREKLIDTISDSIKSILKNNNLTKKQLLGIGLGVPGPVDARQGVVHFFPNIPGWKRVRLRSILKNKLGLAAYVDNDAKLMCLAEYKIGAAKNTRNAVCITLGTGVGGGIIIEGQLYRGFNNSAGEIGHIPINEHGPVCNCGGMACLESYVGNAKILSQAGAIFGKGISLEKLSILSKDGNKMAQGIWKKAGLRLGVALSGVVNLLNPDCIVVGGGVAAAGKILFDSIRKAIINRAMGPQAKHVKVLKAALGNDAGLIGAAILVKEGAE